MTAVIIFDDAEEKIHLPAYLWVVPNSPHATLRTYPDEFNKKVDEFFSTPFHKNLRGFLKPHRFGITPIHHPIKKAPLFGEA